MVGGKRLHAKVVLMGSLLVFVGAAMPAQGAGPVESVLTALDNVLEPHDLDRDYAQAALQDEGMDCWAGAQCIPGSLTAASDVSAGEDHTCALLVTGDVDCWGPMRGESPHGNKWTMQDYDGGDAVAADVGYYLMCVVTSGGNVLCSGWDGESALCNDCRGDDPYTGGQAVDVGVAGGWLSCILLSTGNVDCRGQADYLGGDAVSMSVGSYHVCVVTSGGNVDCWGANGGGQAVDYLGGDAVAVGAGASHTCIVFDSGDADCWGGFEYCPHDCWAPANGYLGGDAVGVSAGASHTCFLLHDGDVDCDGADWKHEEEVDREGVGQARDDRYGDAVGIDVGSYHSCAVTHQGSIRCWGDGGGGKASDYPVTFGNHVPSMPLPPVTPQATVCTPDPSASLHQKDFDHDGAPALYTKRNDMTTVHWSGSVTQRPGPTYCWLAGDPDDDGVQRIPA